MDVSPLAVLILIASAAVSFIVGRFLSRNWREKKRKRESAAREAAQSRQVRRANQRRARS